MKGWKVRWRWPPPAVGSRATQEKFCFPRGHCTIGVNRYGAQRQVGEIKRIFYGLLAPGLYSLLSEAAAKASMSTEVLADSRMAGVGTLSSVMR